MEYNWWDDRELELFHSENNHPCYGCLDFIDGECISHGACGSDYIRLSIEKGAGADD